MTIRLLALRCLMTLALAAAACTAAQAQPSAAGTVTPPVRADVALSGTVLATRNVADHLTCQAECKRTPGCTGYSFNRAAKDTCTLLGGPLTEFAVTGAVSCRMPCEPAPRVSALTQRAPVATLRTPAPATPATPASPATQAAPATQATPARPASLLQAAPHASLKQQPQALAPAPQTSSTQSASFGTGPIPYTPLPPCPAGRVAVAGSCSNAAVAAAPAATPTTVTLRPVNDNTIGSSSLSTTNQNSVFQTNYWFPSPGIGVGCNLMYGVITQIQHIHCTRGLIKFNLASLAGRTIQSATLRLTTSAVGTGAYKDPWYVVASASPWSGTAVTWINYGDLAYTASKTTHGAPTFVGQIFSVDQTATLRSWLSGAYVNNGFAMALNMETMHCRGCDSLNAFEFHSNEDPQARGPQLVVTYQ